MGYASCAQLIMPGSGPNHLKNMASIVVALSFGATREIVAQFGSDRMCSVSRCGWRWSRVREPVSATAVGDAAECRATATIPARDPACGIA